MPNLDQPTAEPLEAAKPIQAAVDRNARSWRVLVRRELEDGGAVYEYERANLHQALSYMNGDPGWRQAGPERSAFGTLARWLFGR